ncbi:hypothetical protein PAP_09865 [Palaeococcus pacificus DY20341]|uniref:DUF835 domain-containing protein n=1 Tax=Palaeococcus pacificus DY20341 TaxID=1343739 RepID=A0A075LWD4_9EURY|nr:DUF835 domain-containing protein [Palaeococcus pacificus]AIF70347.1 hypothetical protein PAP_09865 [Palaeococcus pacificus DY20341]
MLDILLDGIEFVTIAGLFIILVLAVKFRRRFIEKYSRLKKFYDVILASITLDFVSEFFYLPDYIDFQLSEQQLEAIQTIGDSLYALSVLLFIIGFGYLFSTLLERYELIPIIMEFKEEKIKSEAVKQIPPGVYLCNTEIDCYSLFLEILKKRPGLIVSRRPPYIIRETFGLKETPVLWITKVDGENTIHPTRLEYLMQILVDFMKKENIPKAILLDGLEYLILENGFDPMFKVLTKLKDYAIINNTIILVPVIKHAYNEKEFALIAREFTNIREILTTNKRA